MVNAQSTKKGASAEAATWWLNISSPTLSCTAGTWVDAQMNTSRAAVVSDQVATKPAPHTVITLGPSSSTRVASVAIAPKTRPMATPRAKRSHSPRDPVGALLMSGCLLGRSKTARNGA